jgi:hypothetical protein
LVQRTFIFSSIISRCCCRRRREQQNIAKYIKRDWKTVKSTIFDYAESKIYSGEKMTKKNNDDDDDDDYTFKTCVCVCLSLSDLILFW